MRRMAGVMVLAVALLASGCGSDGVGRAEHDLVVSQLALTNQELALAKEQLTVANEQLAAADGRVAALEDEIEELLTIDASEEEVMARQQALGVLGTLFVEFRGGGWSEETVAMFAEFVESTGEESIIEQLDAFAAAVATDPDGEQADYAYGLLGYEIMAALEREVVDPFGR